MTLGGGHLGLRVREYLEIGIAIIPVCSPWEA